MLFVPCILISVPVVVCLKKVQIGPKRSLTNVIAKHCSRIHKSDLSAIYSIYITVFGPRYRLLRVSDFQKNYIYIYIYIYIARVQAIQKYCTKTCGNTSQVSPCEQVAKNSRNTELHFQIGIE